MNSQFIPIEVSSTAKIQALIAKFFAVLKIQREQDEYFEQIQIQLAMIQNHFLKEFIADVSENLEDLWLLSMSEIEELRKAILLWMQKNPVNEIHAVLHHVLVYIAQVHPINHTDPITLEEIDITKRIVTSDGYQFDGESLVELIRRNNKWTNPFNRQPFSAKDRQSIETYARKNNLSLEYTHSRPPVDDLPTMFTHPPAGADVFANHDTTFHAEDILRFFPRPMPRIIPAHFIGVIQAPRYTHVMLIDDDVQFPSFSDDELDIPTSSPRLSSSFDNVD